VTDRCEHLDGLPPIDETCEWHANYDGQAVAVDRACDFPSAAAFFVTLAPGRPVLSYAACVRHVRALGRDLERLGFVLVGTAAHV
jgi:hypothetical protein